MVARMAQPQPPPPSWSAFPTLPSAGLRAAVAQGPGYYIHKKGKPEAFDGEVRHLPSFANEAMEAKSGSVRSSQLGADPDPWPGGPAAVLCRFLCGTC